MNVREFGVEVLNVPKGSKIYNNYRGRRYLVSEFGSSQPNNEELMENVFDFFGFNYGNRGLNKEGYLFSPVGGSEGHVIYNLFKDHYKIRNDGLLGVRLLDEGGDFLEENFLGTYPGFFKNCFGVLPIRVHWDFFGGGMKGYNLYENYKLGLASIKKKGQIVSLNPEIIMAERGVSFDWLDEQYSKFAR